MDDFDLEAIDGAFRPVGRIPDGGALESLGLVTTAGSKRVPTNAGIILFGADAARGRFFPDDVITTGLDSTTRRQNEQSLNITRVYGFEVVVWPDASRSA